MSREQWSQKRQDDIRRRKERIKDLEKNRNAELQNWRSVCSLGHNGLDAICFKKKEEDVNKKFSELIQEEQLELDKLHPCIHGSMDKRTTLNLCRNKRRYDDLEMEYNSDENDWGSDSNEGNDDNQSIGEKSSSVSSNPNNDSSGNLSSEDESGIQSINSHSSLSNESGDDEGHAASYKYVRGKREVIEIDYSNSDSDSGIMSEPATYSDSQHAGDNSSDDDHVSYNDANALSSDQDVAYDDQNEGDFDEDYSLAEIQDYHERSISRGQLTMAMQGFQRPQEILITKARSKLSNGNLTVFDPFCVSYCGRVYSRNRCYRVKPADGISRTIAILRFMTKSTARCILISSFEDTFLGIEDEGYDVDSTMQKTYVQVYKHVQDIHLSMFESDPTDGQEIPDLIYDPRKKGTWHTFGYFYDRNKFFKKTRRKELRTLELFAGAGGSMVGYCAEGFETVLAVEKDSDSVMTLKANNPGVNVYDGCVLQFLKDYDTMSCMLGRIDHIHFSSPCQDFSKANRHQKSGRRERADLTLLLLDFVKKTSCSTAVFENVAGIFDRNNVSYLKNLSIGLLMLGYQIRCSVVRACDFGDPQKRPRVVLLIAKNGIPVPRLPSKTHGFESNLESFVTVEDAFAGLNGNSSFPNMIGRVTSLHAGQHGVIRLHRCEVAPTIRCGSVTPLHFKENRCITVREAACLQSFPLTYEFYGNLTSQYKQVGNAVPVMLSRAIARCIKDVLLYQYKDAN